MTQRPECRLYSLAATISHPAAADQTRLTGSLLQARQQLAWRRGCFGLFLDRSAVCVPIHSHLWQTIEPPKGYLGWWKTQGKAYTHLIKFLSLSNSREKKILSRTGIIALWIFIIISYNKNPEKELLKPCRFLAIARRNWCWLISEEKCTYFQQFN